MRSIALAVLLLASAGCGGGKDQPAFADLHPVKGTVMRNGQPVKGGQIVLTQDPDKQEFGVNSVVGADGTFSLTTYRMTDRTGERKPGAPAGNFKAVYIPDLGDQTAGGVMEPVKVPKPIVVAPGNNDLTIDLPPKK